MIIKLYVFFSFTVPHNYMFEKVFGGTEL